MLWETQSLNNFQWKDNTVDQVRVTLVNIKFVEMALSWHWRNLNLAI